MYVIPLKFLTVIKLSQDTQGSFFPRGGSFALHTLQDAPIV